MKTKKYLILLPVLVLIAIISFSVLRKINQPSNLLVNDDLPNQNEPPKEVETKEEPKPLVDLQPTLDAWLASQSADYSVVVYDTANQKTIASHQPENRYFTASIYKLYVAYIGYQRIADGSNNADTVYINNFTRGQCLDEMIRTSNSPCAEKLWNEIGKETLTSILIDYGLNNTSMVGLYTSAGDVNTLLVRLQNHKDLTNDHTNLLLDSMKNQIYRLAMPKGFTKATVFDKVGFNGDEEYHDVGIVRFDDGREYIVSILSNHAGSKKISDLSMTMQTALYNN